MSQSDSYTLFRFSTFLKQEKELKMTAHSLIIRVDEVTFHYLLYLTLQANIEIVFVAKLTLVELIDLTL